MNLKKSFLTLFLFVGSNATFAQMPAAPDPDELTQALLQQFSPEEQDAIMQEAQQIQDHLDSLSPEDRAREERMLMEEADRMFQNMMQEMPPMPEQKAPTPTPAKKTEEAKPKETPMQKDINSIGDALDALFDSLSSLSLKTQSLPRISTNTAFEQAWPKKEAELAYAKSLFKTAKNSRQTVKALTAKEQEKLASDIKKFGKELKSKEAQLKVPDTAKLKKAWGENKEEACCTEDVKKAQSKVEEIVALTDKYFGDNLVKDLRELLKKISPEDLKRQEARGTVPERFASGIQPSVAPGSRPGFGGGPDMQGGSPYEYYYDPYMESGPYYGPMGAEASGEGLDAEAKDAPDSAQDESDKKKEKEASKEDAIEEVLDEAALKGFADKLGDIDELMEEEDIAKKITDLSKAKKDVAEDLERDLPLSEIQHDLSKLEKHAKKVLKSSPHKVAKDKLEELYKKSKFVGFATGDLEKATKDIKSKGFAKETTLEALEDLKTKHSDLEDMLKRGIDDTKDKDSNKKSKGKDDPNPKVYGEIPATRR